MPQNRHRHSIVDPEGNPVSGVSDLEPPPSVVELVNQNIKADSIWKGWLENFYEYMGTLTYKTNQVFIAPSSITVNTGGTPVGDITDTQTLLDGNTYQVPEVASTPGFDIEFGFEGVAEIDGFVSMVSYVGLATHVVEQRLHDYVGVKDDSFLLIPNTSTEYQYRTVLIPDGSKYINSSNEAIMNIYHSSAGNPAHDIYIDYIAFIGKVT